MIVGEGFSFILGTAIWRIIHVMIPARYECKPIIRQVRIAQQYLVASKFLTGALQLCISSDTSDFFLYSSIYSLPVFAWLANRFCETKRFFVYKA